MNARGIPTAAYQVLHLLSEVGTPPTGYPPARTARGYPRWGTPLQGRVPPSQVQWGGGYPRCRTPWQGTPQQGTPLARSDRGIRGGVPPWQGTPHLDLARVPPLNLAGVPPLGVDRQTDGQTCVKT